MRISICTSVLIAQLLALTALFAAEPADQPELAAMFEADQAARSPENIKKRGPPEKRRRFAVFELISANALQTANDYFHAGVILHHTGAIRHPSGQIESMGTESHLLAFFLFRRAHELGHEPSRRLMGAAYNYYLRTCGSDNSLYGYEFEDGKEIWRPNVSGAKKDEVHCGFDPRPYFAAFDSQPKPGE